MGKKSSFLLGTILGGTLTAAAAIFLAPKSGKEMQKELAQKAEEGLQKVKETIAEVKEAPTSFKPSAKETEDHEDDSLMAEFQQETDDLGDALAAVAKETPEEDIYVSVPEEEVDEFTVAQQLNPTEKEELEEIKEELSDSETETLED